MSCGTHHRHDAVAPLHDGTIHVCRDWIVPKTAVHNKYKVMALNWDCVNSSVAEEFVHLENICDTPNIGKDDLPCAFYDDAPMNSGLDTYKTISINYV